MAVVSGVSCALHFSWVFYGGDIGFSIGFAWLDFAASGGLFAVAVLCPYLPAGRGSIVRAAALLGAGATSYCSAMMTAVNADAWFSTAPVLSAFLLASFIGAAIVLVSAKILLPLRVRKAFWSFGLAASLLGGVAMYAGLEVLGSSTLSAVFGFCAWHVLVCLAIHFGRASNEGRAGLLADFARARGRFSIVPGWLRLSHSALR